MSVTLVYKAASVGPVCERLAKAEGANGKISVLHQDNIHRVDNNNTIVRWGSEVLGRFPKTINSAESVGLAKHKKNSRAALKDLSPETWFNVGDIPANVDLVIRPRRHHAATKFFTAKSHTLAMREAIRKCRLGWYATRLIDKEREFRVFVFQGHAVAVSERFPANEGDVAWNLAVGGRLINVNWKQFPLAAVRAAIDGAIELGLDWAAMDIIIEKGTKKAFVLEANTAPGLRNKYTMKQIARSFVWADTHEVPHLKANAKTWKDYLHPALRKDLQ